MSNYPPTSVAKALGYGAVLGGCGLFAAGAVIYLGVYLGFIQAPAGKAAPEPTPISAPAHTTTYYRQHPTEREARVAWCNDHVGFAMHDADCLAAAAARWQ